MALYESVYYYYYYFFIPQVVKIPGVKNYKSYYYYYYYQSIKQTGIGIVRHGAW